MATFPGHPPRCSLFGLARLRRGLAVLAAMLVAGCGAPVGSTEGAPITLTFDSALACEVVVGGECGFVQCDHVPAPRTRDDVCGPNFQEGITRARTGAHDDAWIRELLAELAAGCRIVSVEPQDGQQTVIVLTMGERLTVRGEPVLSAEDEASRLACSGTSPSESAG